MNSEDILLSHFLSVYLINLFLANIFTQYQKLNNINHKPNYSFECNRQSVFNKHRQVIN